MPNSTLALPPTEKFLKKILKNQEGVKEEVEL
jgi:hypothetical protein